MRLHESERKLDMIEGGHENVGSGPSGSGPYHGSPSSALTASQQAAVDKPLAASHAAAMNAMTENVYLRR